MSSDPKMEIQSKMIIENKTTQDLAEITFKNVI